MSDAVTLREYIESLLGEHDKIHRAEHRADRLVAKELKRRLEVLNHAHEQSVEDRQDFVTAERFDTRTEAVDSRLAALETFRSKALGAAAVLALFAGAVGAIIGKALG